MGIFAAGGLLSAANAGSTLGGIGGLVSGIGGLFGGSNDAEGQMRDQLQFQKEQFKLQKELAFNGAEIRARDYEKAGLNRILAMNPNSAASASPVAPPTVDTPSAQTQASTAKRLAYAQIANIAADTAKKYSEKKATDAVAENTRTTTSIKSPLAEAMDAVTELIGGRGTGAKAGKTVNATAKGIASEAINSPRDRVQRIYNDAKRQQRLFNVDKKYMPILVILSGKKYNAAGIDGVMKKFAKSPENAKLWSEFKRKYPKIWR
jgi:hypothetical protein